MHEYTGRTWLGIANINGEYVAIDGSPLQYTNWDTTGGNKQPNNSTGDEYHFSLKANNKLWNICCSRSQEGNTVCVYTVPRPEDYNLPGDYAYAENAWGNSFYKIYEAKNYNSAKDQCESDCSYLAIPRSDAENAFITSLIPNEKIWIGLNDIDEEGTFISVAGLHMTLTSSPSWNLEALIRLRTFSFRTS